VDVCSRLHSTRLARSSAPRATFTGSAGFSTRPLPRTCDRRCPGQTDRGSPAPLTSNREGAAPDWPKADAAPDFAEARLEPPSKEATPPVRPSNATQRGQPRSCGAARRGARSIRGRARGSSSMAMVGGSPYPPTTGSSAPENHRLWRDGVKGGSAHQPQKARPAAYGARQEGSEAGSRPFPRPKTPRIRVRCPEGPSIKGPHRIGQSMFPGRPGSRVNQRKPWLRRQAQPRPTGPATSVGHRTIRRVLVYVGQLQMLKRRIFPLGHGRPKGQQQTSG
jgi:hypothetical protein